MYGVFKKSKKRKKLEKEGLATKKTRLKQNQTLGHAVNKSKFLSFVILTTVWAFSALLLIVPDKQNFEFYLVENQLAPTTVYSDFNFVYLDKSATEKKQNIAKENVALIFELQQDKCREDIEKASEIIDLILSDKSGTVNKTKVNFPISPDVISSIRMIIGGEKKQNSFKKKLSSILYSGIIDPEILKEYKNQDKKICILDKTKRHYREARPISSIATPKTAAQKLTESILPQYSPKNRVRVKKALYKLALKFIHPNLKYNKELTNLERKIEASSKKNNVYREVRKGDIILLKGEKVTESILQKFNSYEKEKNKRNAYQNFWQNFIQNLVISFLIVTVTGLYFYYLYPKIFQSNQKMGITATVIILSLIGIFLAEKAYILLSGEFCLPMSIKICLLPLGLTAVLLSVLTGVRTATFSSLFIALVAAVKLDSSSVVIMGMAVSCVSGYIVHNAKNYKRYFLKTVFAISTVYIVVQVLLLCNVIFHSPDLFTWIVALSLANGLATAIIALAMLFILESVFQVTTDMSLLSLCDYNHPLLKRLQLEAPGTYHHSLIVATLAEQAANAIGANPLRARVYALFHDIGKLSKPEYFTENNPDSSKRHFVLKPAMSSIVILNHVKEGVNLAIKYKLSRQIRDAIEQHHGTDLVYYFYKRALEESDNKNKVTETEYRYPGPKPREKEIVLLSLVDPCEAASRSLTKPTPSKVEALVGELIRKRIREGQLYEADLTFWELAKIKDSIIKTLNSMLHTRVRYTKEEENDNEGDLFKAAKESLKNKGKAVQKNGGKNSGADKA
ncbi:MAG: HDIG domain-containing protein [Victivallales bacterium]|nr:HDIG domain-containing protein [Victivallales bacterium]